MYTLPRNTINSLSNMGADIDTASWLVRRHGYIDMPVQRGEVVWPSVFFGSDCCWACYSSMYTTTPRPAYR